MSEAVYLKNVVTSGGALKVGSLQGTPVSIILTAETVAANLSGTTADHEVWTSSTGCNGFEIKPAVAFTAGTTYIAVGFSSDPWSTSETTLKTLLGGFITDWTTPAGVENTNVVVLLQQTDNPAVTTGDKIKSIAAVGNAANKYILTVYI